MSKVRFRLVKRTYANKTTRYVIQYARGNEEFFDLALDFTNKFDAVQFKRQLEGKGQDNRIVVKEEIIGCED